MIVVQELERQGQEFAKKAQQRGQRIQREISTLIQTQKREINTLEKQRDITWHNLQSLDNQVKDSMQKKEDLQNATQYLQAETNRKESERASLQRQLDAINEEIQNTQTAYQTNQQSLEKRRRVLESRQSHMIATLNKYSSVLGLKFERSGTTMEFTFSNICEWDSKMEFKVILALDADKNYQVVQSVPPLESLRKLEEHLLRTNDLKTFVISIRSAFKAQTKCS